MGGSVLSDFPAWMTESGAAALSRGYYCPGESTPRELYTRLSNTAARLLNRADLAPRFFDLFWKGWLGGASPVLANFGHPRGLPISCFGVHPGDSVDSIFLKAHEQAMMSKNGGGVAVTLSDIRGRGSPISYNGTSDGVVPWAKVYDSTVSAVSQGSTRRGATSVNLSVWHSDIEEFLNIRRPHGDPNHQCLNIHHCVVVDDRFMRAVVEGAPRERALWLQILKTRLETGEPYIMFEDMMNIDRPPYYVENDMRVSGTNLCTEISLYTGPEHSFVCCLSSLNLGKYDEWKDTDAVQLSVYFLDAVMQDFLNRAQDLPGLDCAVRSAEAGRPLGLGVMGWHTLLQQRGIPFDSFRAMQLNAEVFRQIASQADAASRVLGARYGIPAWGVGRRNTHLTAIAPTISNSLIAGEMSEGIAPRAANAYTFKTAKGTFFLQNEVLRPHLAAAGMDTPEVWQDIAVHDGSVQHLPLSEEVRQVFRTAPEINQMSLVAQAGQRQRWIEQGQSLNLFFPAQPDPKWFNNVHLTAWRSGVKTLYYVRASSVLRADVASRTMSSDCSVCEG